MRDRPANWYLDPLVAKQKKEVHLEWICRNVQQRRAAVVLKTDLFEEANGDDELLSSLPFEAGLKLGIDLDESTARRAALRLDGNSSVAAADVRRLPFKNDSIDLVLSNSTLDHFDAAEDLKTSICELARVLKPGGLLLVTLDNLRNPLYLLFRGAVRLCGVSFRLGHTADSGRLERLLKHAGLEPLTSDLLLHNPRFLSTLLFMALRRLRAGDRVIGALLKVFSLAEKLPTRGYTAVFVAACGRKPARAPVHDFDASACSR